MGFRPGRGSAGMREGAQALPPRWVLSPSAPQRLTAMDAQPLPAPTSWPRFQHLQVAAACAGTLVLASSRELSWLFLFLFRFCCLFVLGGGRVLCRKKVVSVAGAPGVRCCPSHKNRQACE